MHACHLVSSVLLSSCFALSACASDKPSSPPRTAPDPAATAARELPPDPSPTAAPIPQDAAVPHAGMLRFPDVSATHIAFVYADDLWLVPREGGVATPLASPQGAERLPRFAPDGRTIAFMGNYDGNSDLYTLPVGGGVPTRVTYHPGTEVLSGWTPGGRLLFFTNALAGRDRQNQVFTVSASGGLPEMLPVPYGTFADVSSDGRWLAYTPHTTDNRTWKRYRGGMSTDIWLFDLIDKKSKRATDWEGTDTAPMWQGNQLHYLSDDGPSHRLNLWALDPVSMKRRQLTQYDDYDVKWPAIGPGPKGTGEIVFQHGSELALYDLASGKTSVVKVTVPGARARLKPRAVDASSFAQAWDFGPSGKRVLVSARGDVWSVPAKDGSPRNLTRTSGVAERDGTWSPDGKWIAWLSDASGEYEIVLAPADGRSEPRTLTKGGNAFRRLMTFSPDSKQLAFCDKTGTLFLIAVEGGEPRVVERDPWAGDLIQTNPSFSRDSRWLAYSAADADSGVSRIVIHEIPTGERHVVTSGMFDDATPVFDRKGDFLYFRRRGSFVPLYGETDTSFLYAGTEQLCLVTLRADQKSPLAPRSDEEGGEKKDEEKKDAKDEKKEEGEEKDEEEKDEKKDEKPVEIAFDGFEQRAVLLPIDPGVFGSLGVNDGGALLYVRRPIQGVEGEPSIHLFDAGADKPEEKKVADKAGGFALSADGKKLLAFVEGKPQVGDAKEDTKLEPVPLGGMEVEIDPRAEWQQIFTDAWRLMRDFFYDPGMHQVDWNGVREQYAAMLDDCSSREDLSYVIREMISELNVGHAYYSGGDVGDQPSRSVGLLGCDYTLDGDSRSGSYRIARIHEGAPWDADARGPLSQPGVGVKAGDYLLAVNGAPLDAARAPWAAFQGMAGKTVTLTVSAKPALDGDAREVVVKTLESERDVRYRAWIEGHRRYVEEKTDGRVGYIYVPSTGYDGQNDLYRQFQGQLRKDALIIDERWNSGGQIPTRFIELLDRPVTNYWARRDAHDWYWPPDAHFGPKCMLINGLSGSGGDCFPYYFKQAGLGKLIGMRTWGGLIGLSGYPPLIDGGDIECPSFAFYETDGTWGVEGHGVDPDIEVIDDPAQMQDNGDPQLDRAIALMLEELQRNPYVEPKRPAYPDRRGMGLAPEDK